MKKEKITQKNDVKVVPKVKPLGDRVLIKELDGNDRTEKTVAASTTQRLALPRGSMAPQTFAAGDGKMLSHTA